MRSLSPTPTPRSDASFVPITTSSPSSSKRPAVSFLRTSMIARNRSGSTPRTTIALVASERTAKPAPVIDGDAAVTPGTRSTAETTVGH